MFWLFIALLVTIILAWVSIEDLRCFRIPNTAVVALAALFAFETIAQAHYRNFLTHGAFAGIMFVVLLVCYARGMMGGGDAKRLLIRAR